MFQDTVSVSSSRAKNKKKEKENWSSHYGVYIVKNVGGGKFSVVYGTDASG
jgi:hypothetical protein